jgi:hypothetical protein
LEFSFELIHASHSFESPWFSLLADEVLYFYYWRSFGFILRIASFWWSRGSFCKGAVPMKSGLRIFSRKISRLASLGTLFSKRVSELLIESLHDICSFFYS